MPPAEPSSSWKSTALWKELSNRTDEPASSLAALVTSAMPQVETVLASGSTAPTDFTLHDAGHAYRVAERMIEIATPEPSELGPYELCMLLLSAYLHDIGMTPPLSRLEGHQAYLLSADGTGLDKEEIESLQAWLDDEWEGLLPPLATGPPTLSELQLSRRILSGYVRHRHNEWSEKWIREHLGGHREPYPGWLDDLVRLCKSHHYGIDQLLSDGFSPRFVGSPGTVLHLRYCACLLRVADVLDFDPERTPDILFSHRDVSESSAIFWHKDHDLAFKKIDDHIAIHARPGDAITHHAIQLTIREVDSELLLCRRLADQTHFEKIAGDDHDLPHRWKLETTVRAVVTPRDDSYEYIDGTFRPDPRKLLALVGGIELYGSYVAAIREVLQNAFDAVREQIAHQRLLQPDPASSETAMSIARLHRVSLRLEPIDGGYELVCRDSGTGMSREVIRARFLVGGTSINHESRALERACAACGFSVGRTARFGIGVLSYFLLGSALRVRTRRSLEAGDPDGTGWVFTSGGLDDFGELKRDSQAPAGTEIRLKVLDELALDPEKLVSGVHEYVLQTVRRVPCAFDFEVAGTPGLRVSSPPGWIDRSTETEGNILRGMRPERFVLDDPTALLEDGDETTKQREARIARARKKAAEALRFGTFERRLPNGLGSMRFTMGNFDIAGGSSAAFLELTPESDGSYRLNPLLGGEGAVPVSPLRMSWNGMELQTERSMRGGPSPVAGGGLIEIDWTSDAAGRLAVHRNSFRPSDLAQDAIEWAVSEAREIRRRHLEEQGLPALALVNAHLMHFEPELSAPLIWLSVAKDGARALRPFELPAIDSLEPGDQGRDNWAWRGKPISVVPPMSFLSPGGGWNSVAWHDGAFDPSCVAAMEGESATRPTLVWDRLEVGPPTMGLTTALGHTCDFPPEWKQLISIEIDAGAGRPGNLWNAGHPVVKSVDESAWSWILERMKGIHNPIDGGRNPLPYRDDLLANPARLGAWILICIWYEDEPLWRMLVDQASDFLLEAWSAVDGLERDDELVHWAADEDERELIVVSPSRWRSYENSEADSQFAQRFPLPGSDWVIA